MSSWLEQRTKFKVHSYAPGRGCTPLRKYTTENILGKLPDGWWEVEIVKLTPTKNQLEILLRHGSLIHVELITPQVLTMFKQATGNTRPQGGSALVQIKKGSIINVGGRDNDNNSQEDSMEHS